MTEILDSAQVSAIAEELQRRADAQQGIDSLAERKDLEPATVSVLRQLFGNRAQGNRKVPIGDWERVGPVDVVIRAADGGAEMAGLIELKWCGPGRDILYEGISDMFKMALGSERAEQPRGYLLSGAPESVWGTSPFSDLFDDGEHDPVELCARRLADKKQTIAWVMHSVERGIIARLPSRRALLPTGWGVPRLVPGTFVPSRYASLMKSGS